MSPEEMNVLATRATLRPTNSFSRTRSQIRGETVSPIQHRRASEGNCHSWARLDFGKHHPHVDGTRQTHKVPDPPASAVEPTNPGSLPSAHRTLLESALPSPSVPPVQ